MVDCLQSDGALPSAFVCSSSFSPHLIFGLHLLELSDREFLSESFLKIRPDKIKKEIYSKTKLPMYLE